MRSFIGKNSSLFASIMYDLTSTVTTMVELSWLETTYDYRWMAGGDLHMDENNYDELRFQFALKAAIK